MAIRQKEIAFRLEIARVLNKPGGVPADALLRVEAFIKARFDEKDYVERLKKFFEMA